MIKGNQLKLYAIHDGVAGVFHSFHVVLNVKNERECDQLAVDAFGSSLREIVAKDDFKEEMLDTMANSTLYSIGWFDTLDGSFHSDKIQLTQPAKDTLVKYYKKIRSEKVGESDDEI